MSIPPSMNPKLLAGDTYVCSVHVINNTECTVILLTIASAGGPPLNISPSLICMYMHSVTRQIHRKIFYFNHTRLDTVRVLLVFKRFLPSLHHFLVDIPQVNGQ